MSYDFGYAFEFTLSIFLHYKVYLNIWNYSTNMKSFSRVILRRQNMKLLFTSSSFRYEIHIPNSIYYWDQAHIHIHCYCNLQ